MVTETTVVNRRVEVAVTEAGIAARPVLLKLTRELYSATDNQNN